MLVILSKRRRCWGRRLGWGLCVWLVDFISFGGFEGKREVRRFFEERVGGGGESF